jgi:hypothetical protein
MKEYSDKEIKLMTYFGYGEFAKDAFAAAPTIYKMMVEKAFINNMQGLEIESLRRCYKCIQDCSIYRMTPEWDNMISFSDAD